MLFPKSLPLLKPNWCSRASPRQYLQLPQSQTLIPNPTLGKTGEWPLGANRYRIMGVVTRVAARLLGGSWVVISEVMRKVTIVITHISGLITPLITLHEPPGRLS